MPTLGLILRFVALVSPIASAQFDPRLYYAFALPASPFPQQRNLNSFGRLDTFEQVQMPTPGQNYRARFGDPPVQASYGSPLLGFNKLPMMEQQMFDGSASPAFSRHHSFMQLEEGPAHIGPVLATYQFSALDAPALTSLPSAYGGEMNPIGGRSPFQREAGVQMNDSGIGSAFDGLEPLQTSSNIRVRNTK